MSHRVFPFQLNPPFSLSRLFDNDAFVASFVKPFPCRSQPLNPIRVC